MRCEECNVGKADRVIRIILGLVVILAGFYFQSWWGLIGLIFLISGLLGKCKVYSWLGINTNKR